MIYKFKHVERVREDKQFVDCKHILNIYKLQNTPSEYLHCLEKSWSFYNKVDNNNMSFIFSSVPLIPTPQFVFSLF